MLHRSKEEECERELRRERRVFAPPREGADRIQRARSSSLRGVSGSRAGGGRVCGSGGGRVGGRVGGSGGGGIGIGGGAGGGGRAAAAAGGGASARGSRRSARGNFALIVLFGRLICRICRLVSYGLIGFGERGERGLGGLGGERGLGGLGGERGLGRDTLTIIHKEPDRSKPKLFD